MSATKDNLPQSVLRTKRRKGEPPVNLRKPNGRFSTDDNLHIHIEKMLKLQCFLLAHNYKAKLACNYNWVSKPEKQGISPGLENTFQLPILFKINLY